MAFTVLKSEDELNAKSKGFKVLKPESPAAGVVPNGNDTQEAAIRAAFEPQFKEERDKGSVLGMVKTALGKEGAALENIWSGTPVGDKFNNPHPQNLAEATANEFNDQLNLKNALIAAGGGVAMKYGGPAIRALIGGTFAGQGAEAVGQTEGEATANRKNPLMHMLPAHLLDAAAIRAGEDAKSQALLKLINPRAVDVPLFERSKEEQAQLDAKTILPWLTLAGGVAGGVLDTSPTRSANRYHIMYEDAAPVKKAQGQGLLPQDGAVARLQLEAPPQPRALLNAPPDTRPRIPAERQLEAPAFSREMPAPQPNKTASGAFAQGTPAEQAPRTRPSMSRPDDVRDLQVDPRVIQALAEKERFLIPQTVQRLFPDLGLQTHEAMEVLRRVQAYKAGAKLEQLNREPVAQAQAPAPAVPQPTVLPKDVPPATIPAERLVPKGIVRDTSPPKSDAELKAQADAAAKKGNVEGQPHLDAEAQAEAQFAGKGKAEKKALTGKEARIAEFREKWNAAGGQTYHSGVPLDSVKKTLKYFTGVVDSYGSVKATEHAKDKAGNSHANFGYGNSSGRWRYIPSHNRVDWTDVPSESKMDAVESYLHKQGIVPSSHEAFADAVTYRENDDLYHSGITFEQAYDALKQLRPALLVDGKPVVNEGKTHAEVLNKSVRDIPTLEAFLKDEAHVFVDKAGKVYDRVQAGELYDDVLGNKRGTTKLHSEMLNSLPSRVGEKYEGQISEAERSRLEHWQKSDPRVDKLAKQVDALSDPQTARVVMDVFNDTASKADKLEPWELDRLSRLKGLKNEGVRDSMNAQYDLDTLQKHIKEYDQLAQSLHEVRQMVLTGEAHGGNLTKEGFETAKAEVKIVANQMMDIRSQYGGLSPREAYRNERGLGDGGMSLYSGIKPPTSDQFKRWFGKSVLKTKTGEPMLLFHGSKDVSNIETFKSNTAYTYGEGIYFTPEPTRASGYAGFNEGYADAIKDDTNKYDKYKGGTAPGIIPAYISMENPFITSSDAGVTDLAYKLSQTNPTRYDEIRSDIALEKGYSSKSAVGNNEIGNAIVRDMGHDGIIKEWHKGEPLEVVAFYPEQIKSATGNNGAYSKTDSRLLHSGIPIPSLKRVRELLSPSIFYPTDTLPSKPSPRPAGVKSALETSMKDAPSQKLEDYSVARRQPGEKAATFENVSNRILDGLNSARKLDKMLQPKDVMFDMMDGGKGKYDGWVSKNINMPIDRAYQRELEMREAFIAPVRDLQKKLKLTDAQAERIGVYAHMQQKDGYGHLVDSGVSDETIGKIMKSITPEEKQVYQAMRTMLDETLPAVQSVMKELYGQQVKPVRDYFPMPRDWARYDAEVPTIAKGTFDEHGTWKMLELDYEPRGVSAEKGFTKNRVAGGRGAIKVNAFEIFQQHMQDVAHLLAMQKVLHEIGQTVRGEDFKAKYGDMGQDLTLDWLNTVARQGRTGKRFAWLDSLRNNTSKSIVGFRIASQFVHSANVPLAIARTGANNWRVGLDDSFSEAGQALLHAHFQETFERGGGEPALQDAIKAKTDWAFAVQRIIDQKNAQATVLGMYKKLMEEKGVYNYLTAPFDEVAGGQARIMARRAVASPLYKDIPLALSRGGSLGKMFFQFQNTFLDQWSNIRYDLASAGVKQTAYAAKRGDLEGAQAPALLAAKMALAVSAMILIESGIKFGVKQATLAATGNETEGSDEYFKKVGEDLAKRVPGMGQAMSMVLYGESGMPSVDVLTGIAKGGIRTAHDLNSDKATLEQKQEAVRGLVTGTAEMAGVPGASQVGEVAHDVIKANVAQKKEERKQNPKRKRHTIIMP